MMSFIIVIVQYLIPCAVVSACYISIHRLPNPPSMSNNASRRKILIRRRRSNQMLIVVTITHFMSWLPLNVANVVITTFDSDKKPLIEDVENLFILYAVCHLASMTSAITNPLLYGFMNGNFRNQFQKIWVDIKNCKKIKRRPQSNITDEGFEGIPMSTKYATTNVRPEEPSIETKYVTTNIRPEEASKDLATIQNEVSSKY